MVFETTRRPATRCVVWSGSILVLDRAEKDLLRNIADKHGVRIHNQRVRPFAVRAWLAYHASLLVQDTSMTLLCWCMHRPFCFSSPPWECHAQLLLGAILWLAATEKHELTMARLSPRSNIVIL